MPKNKKQPGLGHNRPPKTAAERTKDWEKAQRAEGWRKIWIDPATLGLIDDLGGKSPALFAHHAQLQRDKREQSEKIKKLEENVKQLVELNTTLIEVTSEQAKAKDQQIEELEEREQELAEKNAALEERGQGLAEKNAELEQTAQKRADLIADQTAALDKLRTNLEAERNRSLFDRVIASLLRK